jgi:hypothetical protein
MEDDGVDWKKVHEDLQAMQKDLRKRLRREEIDEYKRTKDLIAPILADKNNYCVDGKHIICRLDCKGSLPINHDLARQVAVDLGFVVQHTHLKTVVVRIKEEEEEKKGG